MATIKTKIRKDQPDANGLCGIIIQYRFGNETPLKHPIGEKIHPSQFDFQKEKVINHSRANEINYIIEQQKKMLQDIVFDLQRKEITPTPKRVKPLIDEFKTQQKVESLIKLNNGTLNKKLSKKVSQTPVLAWEEFIELKKNIVSKATLGIYRTTLEHLKSFCINYNKKLNWELFDNDFYNLWNNYFIEDCENQYGDIGLANNTIGKNFKTLKTFLSWSLEKEYHQNLKFKNYKVVQETSDIHPLSEAHLAKLVAFCDDERNEKRLQKVASLFIFLATTGLRFSDGQNLRWSDLFYSGEGDIEQQILRVTTIKTHQKINIPFSKYSMDEIIRNAVDFEKSKLLISEIFKSKKTFFDHGEIRKYFKNNDELSEPLLPQISSVNFNKYIKEVGEICEFNEPITDTRKSGKNIIRKEYKRWEKLASHDCRRTFITLSLAKGMRPETVMSFTGHTSYKTMLRYNRISDKIKINEFQEIWGNTKAHNDDIFGNYKLTVGYTGKEENKETS